MYKRQCLGGAIRDPLSGRSYVYQAMRVTGSADPRTSLEDTLHGKLMQKKITTEAANGYSSYGNQIGLTTGQVTEVYDEDFVAKRMEIGAVIAAVDVYKRQDSLLSMVQMPKGIPVATVTIDSGLNAALMAMQIMSIKYPKLKEDLKTYRQEMAQKVLDDDKSINQ